MCEIVLASCRIKRWPVAGSRTKSHRSPECPRKNSLNSIANAGLLVLWEIAALEGEVPSGSMYHIPE